MDRELKHRVAANEAVLREVNEGIERGQWPGEENQAIGFRCECARLGCSRLIELRAADYERIRAHPRRFLIAPGHEVPGAEMVVETHRNYVVVEKRDEAGDLAEATDPRS